MISTKTIRRSRGTAADASWLLTPMFGFSPRTRDRSFHIPPLTRRRPRLVHIPSSSAFPPHLVCDNQLVHRPIDLPAGIDGCCGRIVVDTLSCARLGSALGPTLIRIQRKCIPTVRWVGRILSSGARRRCCVIVTKAAVRVRDAAWMQCIAGGPRQCIS